MRIVLVRHGESEANVGNWDCSVAGDAKVGLTEKGQQQARETGPKLAGALAYKNPAGSRITYSLTRNDTTHSVSRKNPNGSTLVYCSPYTRTRQTLAGIYAGAGLSIDEARVYEDARLRETEHGYSNIEEQQALRDVHGSFYYRYSGGESPADCFDRTSSFLESMMRQVARKRAQDVMIVTHGLTIRCFVMRFLHLSVEQFESMSNPHNCDIITIAQRDLIDKPVFTSGRWCVEGIRLKPIS